MSPRRLVFLPIILLALLAPAYAFDFNITVKYQNGTPVENAYVALTDYTFGMGGPPTPNVTNANFTGTNGIAKLFNLRNGTDVDYSLVLLANGTGTTTHLGPSLPFMPSEMFQWGINGETVYVEEAVTFNFTINNGTAGNRTAFQYDVLDNEFGDYIAWSESNSSATNLITLPKNRNYTFNLYGDAPPITIEWTNASEYPNGAVINYELNGTVRIYSVAGRVELPGGIGMDSFTGINYIIEGGRIFDEAAFSNIGTFAMGGNDTYNVSSGEFNVSLPAMTSEIQSMMVFFARNGSTHYALFYNITLDLTDSDMSIAGPLNLSALYGANGNWSIQSFSGTTQNINSSVTLFNVTSTEGDHAGMFAEFEVTYPGGKIITWNSESSDGSFYLPLPNSSNVTAQIFGASMAPVRYKFNSQKLASSPNFTIQVSSFDGEDSNGNDITDLDVEFYNYHNVSCRVPNPDESCSLFSFTDFSNEEDMDREGMKMMLLDKADVEIYDNSTGVGIQYIGVDLSSAGAPPARMDTTANESAQTSSSIEEAWRFGSTGPEIYDYVLVTIPLNTSKYNETQDINMSIDSLYDTNNYGTAWVKVWDRDNYSNLTSAHNAATQLSDYSARFSEWSVLINGTVCHTNSTGINITNPCYKDTENDEIVIRIPHFSGSAPQITGVPVTTSSNNNGGLLGGSSNSNGRRTTAESNATANETDDSNAIILQTSEESGGTTPDDAATDGSTSSSGIFDENADARAGTSEMAGKQSGGSKISGLFGLFKTGKPGAGLIISRILLSIALIMVIMLLRSRYRKKKTHLHYNPQINRDGVF